MLAGISETVSEFPRISHQQIQLDAVLKFLAICLGAIRRTLLASASNARTDQSTMNPLAQISSAESSSLWRLQ